MQSAFDRYPFTSWYEDTVERPDYPPLDTDRIVDVCIIGGGFTGLSAALELARSGLSVTLIEQGRVGGAASGRNGGQIWTGFHHSQKDLERKHGKDIAHELWAISQDAKSRIHALCKRYDIDAQVVSGRSVFTYNKRSLTGLEANANYLAQHYDYDSLELIEPARCSDYIGSDLYYGGIMDHGSGHLHPLRMALGMARAAHQEGAEICEHTPAKSYAVKGGKVEICTENGRITADKLVLACNALVDDLTPYLARRFAQVVDFVITTEPLGDMCEKLIPGNHAVSDTNHHLSYYRMTQDGRLLFGGSASSRPRAREAIDKRVRMNVERVFPQLSGISFSHHWYGAMAFTLNQMPQYGILQDRIYFAHGYSGLGVTIANMSGAIVADAILGERARFDMLAGLGAPVIPGTRAMKRLATEAGLLWYKLVDAKHNIG